MKKKAKKKKFIKRNDTQMINDGNLFAFSSEFATICRKCIPLRKINKWKKIVWKIYEFCEKKRKQKVLKQIAPNFFKDNSKKKQFTHYVLAMSTHLKILQTKEKKREMFLIRNNWKQRRKAELCVLLWNLTDIHNFNIKILFFLPRQIAMWQNLHM